EAIRAEIARQAAAEVALYDDEGVRITPPADAGAKLPPELHLGGGSPGGSDAGHAVLAVRAGSETLGWLAVRDATAPDRVRRRALEHGVTVLALELSRARAAAEAERRLRGDLMEELVARPLSEDDAQRLVEQAARLGYRLHERMWVVLIEPD